MLKPMNIFFCVFLFCFDASVFCQTHCMLSTGEMILYLKPYGTEFTKTDIKIYNNIKITQSAGGLLAYLEQVADDFDRMGYAFMYGFGRKETLATRPYEPEKIVLRLHVCDRTGVDKYVIPIAQKYVHPYTDAVFLGESYVNLQFNSRVAGCGEESFINLKSGEILSLFQDSGVDMVAFSYSSVSPDDSHYLVYWDERTYLDGKMVFPYYDANPLRTSLSPEEYQSKEAEIEQTMKSNPVPRLFSRFRDSMWSPDSRYFALINIDDAPKILIVDTEKIGPGKPSSEFIIQTIPVEMSKEEFLPQHSQFEWSSDGSTLSVKWEESKKVLMQVPLESVGK